MNRHTNTRAGVRGAEAYLYSLTVSMNAAPDMNHDPFHFLSPVKGGYHALTHPLIHTPEILPAPWLCFLPATLCVCVCVRGTLSSRRARRTHFLCQIASHIPHSPSIRPAWAIFSPPPWSFSLSSSLWGALSAIGGTKHWFIPRVEHDPQEHDAFPPNTDKHTHKTHLFKEREGWREQVVGIGDSLFLSPHTDRWTVRVLMKANGCARTHTQAIRGTQQMSVGKSVSHVK